jgi:hypothetical protein
MQDYNQLYMPDFGTRRRSGIGCRDFFAAWPMAPKWFFAVPPSFPVTSTCADASMCSGSQIGFAKNGGLTHRL